MDAIGRRQLSEAVDAQHRLPHTEIELGENIRASEPEHEEHMGGPTPDSLYRRERSNDFIVVERMQFFHRETSIAGSDCEVAQVSDLLSRKPPPAQALVGRFQQRPGFWGAPAEAINHPPVNRTGRAARKLLVDDRTHQRIEVRPVADRCETALAHSLDDIGQTRVGATKMIDGFAVHARNVAGGRFAPTAPPAHYSRS